MSRFVVREATLDDDVHFREIMRDVKMRGNISVSFRREPSYFAGCKVQGVEPRAALCWDSVQSRAVGFGARLKRDVYINGVKQRIGFLSDLRILEKYRNRYVLHKLYRYLRAAHQADPVPFYLTVILDGNKTAHSTLVGGRAGLPYYTSMGRINTPLILLGQKLRTCVRSDIFVSTATDECMPIIYDYLCRILRTKQFSSIRSIDQLSSCLAAPKAKDYYVATCGGEVVGVVLAWDQMEIRQTYVESYVPWLATARPLYNIVSGLFGGRKLPAPGKKLSYFYLSHIAVNNDCPEILKVLINHILEDRKLGPWLYCVPSLHQSDRLNSVLTSYKQIEAGGELFIVHYDVDLPPFEGRIPYIDIAMV